MRLGVIAFLLAMGVMLSSCSAFHGTPTAPNVVELSTPRSVSPGSVKLAPMARTSILPASFMLTRTPAARTKQVAVQGMNYTQIPGTASFVAGAPDGSAWVLSDQPAGPDKYIWHYSAGTWTNISGLASKITVAPDGTLYAINSGGGAYSYRSGSWSAFGGGCRDLTAAADGSLYVISNSATADGAIWHYAGGAWTQQPGMGNKLAASWDTGTYTVSGSAITPGGFYVVNSLGAIYYLGTSGYVRIPGYASTVAPGNGGFFVTGYPTDSSGNSVYYFDLDNGGWSVVGNGAVSISAGGGRLYIISANGGVYQALINITHPGTIPVQASSFANAKSTNMPPQNYPIAADARAFADFFQNGTYSLFMASLEYNPSDPSTYSHKGHLYFYQNSGGSWVDKTSSLLSDNVGCLHPRKAVVADFNGDGKPDVFLACHGLDASPFPGEPSIVLLSEPDGTYKKTVLPWACFCHGASAAVLNKPGYADVVVVDQNVAHTPYFLINNGDGTFHQDFTRLPSSLRSLPIYTTELIDLDHSGKFDLLLAGNEPYSQGPSDPNICCEMPTTIYRNNGSNTFDDAHKIVIPSEPTYGTVLDVVYQNANLYFLRTNSNYSGSEVQKVTYPALNASSIYTHNGAYPGGPTWIDWIVPYNGSIVSDDNARPASIAP